MADYDTTFAYTDFMFMKDGRPTKWRRIHIEDLPTAVAEAANHDAYNSIQRYSDAIIPVGDTAEMHYCPLYFDFDAPPGEVATAQRETRILVDWLKDSLDLDDPQIRIWFSGQKGFHVLVSPTAFGVVPMEDLTYVYKSLAEHVAQALNLTTLDLSVYSRRRVLRVENTVHRKTNLYKRELDHDEITLDIDAIKGLAAAPRRKPVVEPEEFEGDSVKRAVEFLDIFQREYAARREAAQAQKNQIVLLDTSGGDPVCVQDIMGGGLKKAGDRNKATLALAGYYKDTGQNVEVAIEHLTRWALNQKPGMRHPDDAHVRANTKSVITAVYGGGETYSFGCRFIRSLHGPKTSADYERVACAGESCAFIHGKPTEPEVTDVHLSAIGDPRLLDKAVRTRLRVAGRQESAYLVPAKVTYFAIKDSDADCERPHCLLHGLGGKIERDYSTDTNTRTLLAMCGVNDTQLRTVLRGEVERVSCKQFGYTVSTYVRVTAMTCVPKAESFVFDPADHKVHDETGGDFSYQRVYAVAEDFKVNSYYEVIGQVYAHPKDQEAVLVVTESTPAQDAIEDFDLDTVKHQFAPYEGSVMGVFGHLIADLGVNICKVGGRQAALAAILMTMHSPLTLTTGGQTYGGWMQTLVVGDTGEAKSQMVERLVRHVGLGELQSAQSSGRTGLLYTIVTPPGADRFLQWGSFVMNDRRFLVIDEASGMSKTEYAELRNARRDGVFKVNRSVSGEASTRTRLLVLSNPQYGKNMNEFRAGIECVEQLFENADIRRFDLVVGFRHGSVTQDMIDAQLNENVTHLFTSEVLRANVLWAWSRKPEDIVWAHGAQEAVKRAAKELNRKYEGSEIHLLSQDAPEKIARMAQALAATLHSTDGLHNNLIIRPEHVALVCELVDTIYSAPDLDFELYVKQNADTSADIDYERLMFDMRRKIAMPFGLDIGDFLEFFSSNKTISPFVIETFAGDSKAAKMVVKEMFNLKLIRLTTRSGSFEPTARFKELMRRYNRSRA